MHLTCTSANLQRWFNSPCLSRTPHTHIHTCTHTHTHARTHTHIHTCTHTHTRTRVHTHTVSSQLHLLRDPPRDLSLPGFLSALHHAGSGTVTLSSVVERCQQLYTRARYQDEVGGHVLICSAGLIGVEWSGDTLHTHVAHVRESLWGMLCARARVCVCVCVRASVRACMRAASVLRPCVLRACVYMQALLSGWRWAAPDLLATS